MEAQLRAFLQEVRVKKGEPFTHVTKRNGPGGWSSGSYYIGGEDLEKFWVMYCNLVRKGVNATIAERSGRYAPLRVDFDFTSDLENGLARQYSRKTLKHIVKIYQEEIKKIINKEDFDEKQLAAIVLEKAAPRVEEGKVKDGFHIHFPYFICEGWVQDNYIRDKVVKRMIEEKVWKKAVLLTDIDDVIDRKMANKPWMIYGSMNYKNKKSTPYFYKRGKSRGDPDPVKGFPKEWGVIYDSYQNEIDLDTLFEEEMIGRKSTPKYYLPRLLSIRGYNEPTPLVDTMEKKRSAFGGKTRKKKCIKKTRSQEEVITDLKIIKDGNIMEMISDDRAENFDEWMDLGWTLFNIGQGCDEALEIWDNFSRRSSKYIEGECEERWHKMEMRDKTIASILAIARSDNPNLYKQWKDTNVRFQLWASLREPKPNEYDVSKVVKTMYDDKFKCVDAKRNLWYRFENHRWQEMDDGLTMRQLFAEEVVQQYWELNGEIANRQTNSDNDERNKLAIQADRCKAIITKLKECQFQDRLIKMCKLHMYDKDFMKKRDENRNLLGCENGVLDLELGIFRDGRPDDYITFSTMIDFVKFNEDDEEVIEFDDLIKKIFTNKNRREYFLDFVTSCMKGGNVHKRFLIATGMGDNGKSVTFKIIELAFGDYFGKFPRELIIQSKGSSSSSARPELAQVRGKRIMGCQEVAKTEKMNIGVIKELTGNDSIYTRQIYEKGTTILPQFTLMMQCLTGCTPVAIPGGFSMPIRSLKANKRIMSWSKSEKGLIPADQTRFLNQGVKKCVKLTLLDGSEITCTPDHRFLEVTPQGKNKWIEAQNIIIGETELVRGVHQPFYDIENEKTTYKFEGFNLNKLNGKLKAMTCCRLLGYMLADGSNNKVIYIGHSLDAEQIVCDIELLTSKRPIITADKSCLRVHIPIELQKIFNKLSPAQGKRINEPMTLPEFIFDKKCPDFLIREFIAGLFGGDGIIPCVMENYGYKSVTFSPMSLIASKIDSQIHTLIDSFSRLSALMKEKFGIKSNVGKPYSYEEGKSKILLSISHKKSLKTFIEKIGVRYCCHKAHRITAVLSYLKYRECIIKQNEEIVNRTKDLVDIYKLQNPTYKIAQFDKNTNTLIKIYESTQKVENDIGLHHSAVRDACKRNIINKNNNSTSGGYIWRLHYDIEPIIQNEPGCKTIKEALQHSISEQSLIFNNEKIVTYTQMTNRLRKGDKYTTQQLNDMMMDFLESTGLYDFCNNLGENKTSYSVNIDKNSLPTYKMKVINRVDAGKHEVFDITVEKPYSNFLANGVVSHNCNELPGIPGHDEATWKRVRVLDCDSHFIKPTDIKKYPVPESHKEQVKKKTFHADESLSSRFEEFAQVLLWRIFTRYPDYKKRGLKEPKEVIVSTDIYKAGNDIYLQFIKERIEKVEDEKEAEGAYIRLTDMYTEFKEWYVMNHPSYSKDKIGKAAMKNELNKRLGVIRNEGDIYGFGKQSRWWGYKMYQDEEAEVEDFANLLGKKD